MDCIELLGRLAQIFTGIAALFVSSLALFFTIRETRRKAEHDRLTLLPFLVGKSDMAFSKNSQELFEYSFSLKNAGVGPARILKMTYSLGGVDQKISDRTDLGRLLIQCLGPHTPPSMWSSIIQPNYLLGAKEEHLLLKFELSRAVSQLPEVIQRLRKLRLVVTYESLHKVIEHYDSNEKADPNDEMGMW